MEGGNAATLTTADLDACDFLSVWKFPDYPVNELRFELAESSSTIYETFINNRLFAVTWKHFLTYQVINECADGVPDPYEVRDPGRLFFRITRSRYMDYVRDDPGIRERYFEDFKNVGELQHWRINCENHLIDVVAPDEPAIELLESPWENKAVVRQRFEDQLKKNRQESIQQTRRDRLRNL